MPLPPGRLDQLTFTRFVAALSVVFFHGGRQVGILRYFPMLTAGPTAVGYFFVLSGFVMALAYYRPGGSFQFKDYWLARFSRIYPVYLLAFALAGIQYFNVLLRVDSTEVWANMLLYQAWIPKYVYTFNTAAWSLSVEAFFYLLLPGLLLLALRMSVKQIVWFTVGFWVLSQAGHGLLMQYLPRGSGTFLAYFPLFHLNAFLFGLAGGIWYLTTPRFALSQSVNRIVLIGALGVLLFLLSLREYLPAFTRSFSLDVGLLSPLFLLIILTLAWDTSRLSQSLSHPWLVLLGDASYALYILHLPIRGLLNRLLALMNSPISVQDMFLLYVVLTILFCVIVFKAIERPARGWLRTNPHTLKSILLDAILILVMIRFSFVLRLGTETSDVLRAQNLALRVGSGIFVLSLFIFRFYATRAWRSLGLAVFCGAVTLSGWMYVAWIFGKVEVFPRSILILIPVLIFTAIALSRFLSDFLKRKAWNPWGFG